MSESYRLLRRFAAASLLLLCVAGLVCGGALVDSNTRYLALGERGRQVSFALDRQTQPLSDPDTPDPFAAALQWARYAPAPAGTLVMLGEAVMGFWY